MGSLAVHEIKANKAPGTDLLSNDILKILPEEALHMILKLFNLVIETGNIPKSWKESLTILIEKKTSVENLDHLRPISLMQSMAKMFELILQRRMAKVVKISEHQAAYQKDKSTLDNILKLNLLAERKSKSKEPLIAIFIDF